MDVTDGRDSHVLTMPTGYYTFFGFIDAVGVEMVKVLPLISMTIEDDHVSFNDQSNSWYFDQTSVDTTIDGFGWTLWLKLFSSTRNLCTEHPVENVFDPSGPSLPDATNGQGLGGHAHIDPNTYIEYDWQLCMNDYRFLVKPYASYTMTNS